MDVVQNVQAIPAECTDMFSLVLKLLKLQLVIPATSATAGRSFSALKRVKSYLRTTMGLERLNHLCLLSVYAERAQALDIDKLVKEFSSLNAYLVNVFGH